MPQRLSRDEAARLLAQPNRRYPTGLRNKAMLRILYRCGLRCDELLSLRLRDVQIARHEIRVNEGKGAKDRIVWMDAATAELVDAWKARRSELARTWPAKTDSLFTTLDGGRIDNSYMRHMLNRYGRKAGIEIRCHPHLLRHTFASEFLEDGGTLIELQAQLGHDRLETTAIYSHVSNERLRRWMIDRPG